MQRSTINHVKSGDTNSRGQPRSSLSVLYNRSLPSQPEEKAQLQNFCRLRRQTALWYTLDEDQRMEREVRNCPPKRVKSTGARSAVSQARHHGRHDAVDTN